jgi:chemotaxis protein MotB
MAEQPIIKKVIKKGGHGHHGGAWKLAYADFVTAMMAFFLLMWLLGTTDEKTKKGISDYFQDPYKATKVDKGLIPSLDQKNPTEIDKQANKIDKLDEKSEKEDKAQLESLRIKIEKMIKMNDKLDKMKDQIQLTITPEGLRIQIVDDKQTPMFKSGSAEAAPYIRGILKELAPVINQLPNKITVNGHTDSKPFPDASKKYTNWELSSERANAARHELNQAGYEEQKILRVSGLADSVPYNSKDALDPINRRISIIVMNKKAEQQLMEDLGNKPNPGQGKGHEAKAAPSAEGGHGEEPTKPAESATEGHASETTAPADAVPNGENPKPDPEQTPESHAESAPATETHEPPAAEEKPAAEATAEPAPEPDKH